MGKNCACEEREREHQCKPRHSKNAETIIKRNYQDHTKRESMKQSGKGDEPYLWYRKEQA
jgi:hypothetical protein